MKRKYRRRWCVGIGDNVWSIEERIENQRLLLLLGGAKQ